MSELTLHFTEFIYNTLSIRKKNMLESWVKEFVLTERHWWKLSWIGFEKQKEESDTSKSRSKAILKKKSILILVWFGYYLNIWDYEGMISGGALMAMVVWQICIF